MDQWLTDAELLIASRDRPEVFGELFRRHHRAVFAYAVRSVGPDVGADVAAEVFVRAFRVRDRFDPMYDSAKPWLLGIASNLVSDHWRSQGRRTRAHAKAALRERELEPFDVEAVDRLDASARGDRLRVALAALRPEEARVVSLLAIAGLTYNEIAEVEGVPIGTVRSRLSRARVRLRNLLGDSDESGVHDV